MAYSAASGDPSSTVSTSVRILPSDSVIASRPSWEVESKSRRVVAFSANLESFLQSFRRARRWKADFRQILASKPCWHVERLYIAVTASTWPWMFPEMITSTRRDGAPEARINGLLLSGDDSVRMPAVANSLSLVLWDCRSSTMEERTPN